MVWCKHGFQRQRLNSDGEFVRFKGNVAKELIKEFMNEGWGLNKLLKKLQETGTTARRSGSIESIQNISCFFSIL